MQNPTRASAEQWDQDGMLVDGMLCNGVDVLAEQRTHMRELTMARQAAERDAAAVWMRRAGNEAPLLEQRERVEAARAKLARLQADHQAWQLAHGAVVEERHPRRRRARGASGTELRTS